MMHGSHHVRAQLMEQLLGCFEVSDLQALSWGSMCPRLSLSALATCNSEGQKAFHDPKQRETKRPDRRSSCPKVGGRGGPGLALLAFAPHAAGALLPILPIPAAGCSRSRIRWVATPWPKPRSTSSQETGHRAQRAACSVYWPSASREPTSWPNSPQGPYTASRRGTTSWLLQRSSTRGRTSRAKRRLTACWPAEAAAPAARRRRARRPPRRAARSSTPRGRAAQQRMLQARRRASAASVSAGGAQGALGASDTGVESP